MSAMGKLKKGHAYFRFTRWSLAFQSDLCGVLQSGTQEARETWSMAPGTGGADIFHSSLLLWLSLASLQIYPCFANTVFVTESVQKLTTSPHPFLTQESSKNNVLRMGWGLKRCQRGSWPWRAQTPLVQEDRFCFSFRMCTPLRLHKGSLLSCHRLPGPEMSCHEGSLLPAIS